MSRRTSKVKMEQIVKISPLLSLLLYLPNNQMKKNRVLERS